MEHRLGVAEKRPPLHDANSVPLFRIKKATTIVVTKYHDGGCLLKPEAVYQFHTIEQELDSEAATYDFEFPL